MSSADDYERLSHRSHRSRARKNVRNVNRNQYLYSNTSYPLSDPSHSSRNSEIITRPVYPNSEISVEEIHRDFSPPNARAYYNLREDWRGIHSHFGPYSPKRHQPYEFNETDIEPRISNRKSYEPKSTHSHKHLKPRRRSLSKNEMIAAAVGGAALAIGGKELWDRKKTGKHPAQANTLKKVAMGAAGAIAAYEGAEIYSNHNGKDRKDPKDSHRSTRNDDANNDTDREKKNRIRSKRSKSRHRLSHEDDVETEDRSSIYSDRKDKRSIKKRDSSDSLASHGSRKARDSAAQLQKIAKTALLVGATEAFRVRNEPGGWSGEKGKRVLTAAIGATAMDVVSEGKGKRHILESVIAGLASNRLINGSRHRDDDRSTIDAKYRSRSQSRGPGHDRKASLAALVSAGMGSLAEKKTRGRSRSRSRVSTSRRHRESPLLVRGRSPSSRPDDDRSKRGRSKSVTEFARRGLAALGLVDTSDHEINREIDQRHRTHKNEPETRHRRRSSRYQKDFELDDGQYHDYRYPDSPNYSTGSVKGRRGQGRSHKNLNGERYTRRTAYDSSDSFDTLGSLTNDDGYMRRPKDR